MDRRYWMCVGLAAAGFGWVFGCAAGNFWVKITVTVCVLCAASFAAAGVPCRRAELTAREALVGAVSAAVLYGIFWLGDFCAAKVFGFAPRQVEAIYAIRELGHPWAVGAVLLLVTSPGEELFWRGYVMRQAVARWGWPDEMREILSTMVSRYPAEKWAAELLTQNLFSEGRTRSLMSLFSTQLSADPDNLAIKNNLAMTAMLLEANELRPYEMARQVYEASPTNAAYASTYAYALHRQAKDAEALAVFEKLTAEQRAEPSIAGYYAMMLRANGRGEEAKRYFELSAEARMLPEERRVIDEARAGL